MADDKKEKETSKWNIGEAIKLLIGFIVICIPILFLLYHLPDSFTVKQGPVTKTTAKCSIRWRVDPTKDFRTGKMATAPKIYNYDKYTLTRTREQLVIYYQEGANELRIFAVSIDGGVTYEGDNTETYLDNGMVRYQHSKFTIRFSQAFPNGLNGQGETLVDDGTRWEFTLSVLQ